MEREILFRGKRIDNGEWVEGYFTQWKDWQESSQSWSKHCGIISISWCNMKPNDCDEVVPETVGQFIGVKGYVGAYEIRHNNEIKLFEGDIVEAMSQGSKGIFVIKMRTEAQPTFMLYPAWQEGKMWNIAASDLEREKGDYFDDLKVIGNIHNNTEFL